MLFANRRSAVVICALATGSLAGCRARGSEPAAPIRLVDLYKPAGAAPANHGRRGPSAARGVALCRGDGGGDGTEGAGGTERAGGGAKPPVWTAGPGIQGLTVSDGRLVGRTAGDVALIDLERPPSDDRDVVHEIQVRMRASAGTNLSVLLRPTEKVDLKVETDVLPIIPAPFNSPSSRARR